MKKFWVLSIFMTVLVGSVAADSAQWGLPEGARARLGKGVVRNIAFSPDGRHFAVAGVGIWLYDARTYEAVTRFSGEHPYTVGHVVFSPDGKLIASCGELDDAIRLWDVETGTILRTFVGNATSQLYGTRIRKDDGTTYRCTYASWTGHVGQTSFSPDGKLLANGNWDGSVDIWDVSTGRNLHTITTERTEHSAGHPPQVSFRSDGQTLASYNAKEIRFWDVETGRLLERIYGEALSSQSWWLEWYHGQVFSPDRRIFAQRAGNFAIAVQDVATGDLLHSFRHIHEIGGSPVKTEVGHYRFSPDGQTLAIAGLLGGPIDFWDVKTGRLLHTIYGHTSLVDKVAFSPDGRTLASNDTAFIYLWDARTHRLLHTLSGHTSNAIDIAFSSDGRLLATASYDQRVLLWDVATGGLLREFKTDAISGLAYSPDGRIATRYDLGNTLNLWRATTGRHLQTLQALQEAGGVTSITFSPNGDILASGEWAGVLSLWDTRTGRLLQRLHGDNIVIKDNQSTFIDSGTGDERSLTAMYGVTNIAFSPDGRLLASVGEGGGQAYTLHLWDVSTGKHLRTFTESSSQVHFVAFSPDGHTLLTTGASSDKTIRFWEVATGALLRRLSGHKRNVGSISFSPDGQTMASASEDGTVLLWDYPLMAPTPEPAYLPADINRDGIVNITDLVYVSRRIGQTCGSRFDVNSDGVVDIVDLVQVAGAIGNIAGAPQAEDSDIALAPTRIVVEQWLYQAKQVNLADASFQRGMLMLEQLLVSLAPKKTQLLSNYPNPFNPETWIPYQLVQASNVEIVIYDVRGGIIRRLQLGHQPVGHYINKSRAAYWDGKNDVGEPVASGLYFYTLTAGDFTATRKLLIRK